MSQSYESISVEDEFQIAWNLEQLAVDETNPDNKASHRHTAERHLRRAVRAEQAQMMAQQPEHVQQQLHS